MWKWLFIHSIKSLAEPVFDLILHSLEELAKRSSNTIDDAFVEKFKEFKEAIVGWIISNSSNLSKYL